MKQLALAAFVWCSVATPALDAQEKRSSQPLLDAPGPGYRAQRDRFTPPVAGGAPIRLRTHIFSFADPSSLSLLRGTELPPLVGRLSSGASFGIRGGESPGDREERLEFERRFEELKTRLEKASAP